MALPSKPVSSQTPAGRSDDRPPVSRGPGAAVTGGLAWLVPGAGHLLQGQLQKSVVFFVVLMAMFAIGLSCGGRLFPYTLAEPLVFLAALSQWVLGGPRLMAAMGGWGQGDVVAAAYEYGNTFLIVAGLLNALVVLDAIDLARGKTPR